MRVAPLKGRSKKSKAKTGRRSQHLATTSRITFPWAICFRKVVVRLFNKFVPHHLSLSCMRAAIRWKKNQGLEDRRVEDDGATYAESEAQNPAAKKAKTREGQQGDDRDGNDERGEAKGPTMEEDEQQGGGEGRDAAEEKKQGTKDVGIVLSPEGFNLDNLGPEGFNLDNLGRTCAPGPVRGVASEGFNLDNLEAAEGFNVDNLGGRVHAITVTAGGTAIEPGFEEEEYIRGLRGEEVGDPPKPAPLKFTAARLDDEASIEPFAQAQAIGTFTR